MVADTESDRCDNFGHSRILRGQTSEMGWRHNDHRRPNLPRFTLLTETHLELPQRE